MKNLLDALFRPYYGILRPFYDRCFWGKHKWEVHKTKSKVKFKTLYPNNSSISKHFDYLKYVNLKYRKCKTCGQEEISKSLFGKDNWELTKGCPKEIKTYMSKVNLDENDMKVLEEYIDNLNGTKT